MKDGTDEERRTGGKRAWVEPKVTVLGIDATGGRPKPPPSEIDTEAEDGRGQAHPPT